MAKKTTGKSTVATEKAATNIKETASEIMKEAVNKAKEVKETVAEKAKDTTAKTKDTAAKSKEAAAKKAASETCFVEFSGKQISIADVTENAKKHWKASNNGTISDIKIYINTKESKAYYVVNNEDHGDFDL
ncbi:MAG: DUF6465 family protein [Oscillospiraceae bacterium]|nr:DUF6465 family protein [Oscillospiraceae bacterium]